VSPPAAGRMPAVTPLIPPPARRRSPRRFTAGAESETRTPISAYEARASAIIDAMICWSVASICNESFRGSNDNGYQCQPRVPDHSDREPGGAEAANTDIPHVSAGALRRRVRHPSLDGHLRPGRRGARPQAVATAAGDARAARPYRPRAARVGRPPGYGVRGERRFFRGRRGLWGAVPLPPAAGRGTGAPRLLLLVALLPGAIRRTDRDQRGRSRRTVPARRPRRLDPRRVRVPHRTGCARRGAGDARPPGDLAAPGRSALLPPGRGAGRAQ